MLPTLKSGDIVLIDPREKGGVGEIVAANHPYMQSVKLIKRVESISTEGRYALTGDNPSESTDSRTFGSVAKHDIFGKVVCWMNSQDVSAFLARRP
jgi:nickel-type superoxide dismutase maturation protease